MNALDAVRLFSDGSMSMLDTRDLLISMGFTRAQIAEAFVELASEQGSGIRVGRYDRNEYQAELYLTAN